ncbi:PaaI family thioesterase [Candidatus Atribacteria bacterium MT.SAG.1]|nr:PaaI family thioesterase [Candidatus Atribacteria bacterium MT.SAG.1]
MTNYREVLFLQALPGYKNCFVCGKDNLIGLNITFFRDQDKIRAEFVPESKHEGFKGIVHGGILFSILDEIMGRTAITTKGVMTMTVEVNIKYRKKVIVGEKIIFNAQMTKDLGRVIEAKAEARSEDGTLLTEAKGKFIVVSKEMQKEVEEYMCP